ncbi:MAG: PKD domain-containing protein [Saprospiraceae bacterium]|nr:PKD domain-containing protein [Saprospiraceae bacterium]
MRYLKLTLLLLLLTDIQTLLAQKHDYMWPLGLGPSNNEYRFFYDFKNSDIVLRNDTMSTGVYTASYCDANGSILYYSNGLKILNHMGDLVENGEGLNPTVAEWQTYTNYPAGQSGFFLQKPGDPNLLYFISLDLGPHPAQQWPYMFTGQNLMAATIDITANNGAGKVIEKNEILLTGTLMSPAACRHANGRDWWILVSNADENVHYRVLLSPEGFSTPDTQHIGTKPNPIPYNGGDKGNQIVGNCFSPQGRYYADINDKLGFSIFEFDRCSGLLSNEKRENWPPNPTYPNYYPSDDGTGAVFSQNERFFYKTTTNPGGWAIFVPTGTRPYLYQYDLSAQDMAASRDTINILDSADFHYPYNITWETFRGAELGPDGRIYIVHSGLGYITVQYPDRKGKNCKLIEEDDPFFDVVIGSAIPYMPNYRLGPLDGSPCDTLGLDNVPVSWYRYVQDTLDALHVVFTDLSYYEPATWSWDFGDGSAGSVEQHPTHQFPQPDVYQVCLTVSNQYGSDTHCKTLYLGVSAQQNPVLQTQVQVWPNPFRDRLAVALSANLRSPVFRMHDMTGRLVQKAPMTLGVNEIVTADLPLGIYFWEVLSGGLRVKNGKLLKTVD